MEANYYGILPAPVRYNTNLTPRAIVLYSELTALTKAKGYCWASNKYFADLYNASPKAVSEWVNALKHEQFITVKLTKTRNGTKRKIYLNPLHENVVPPLHENVACNSIITNTPSSKERVSKDTKATPSSSSERKKVFKTPFTERCITRWSEFPFTQKIRITQKTKTIEKVEKYLGQLLRGTFLSSRGTKSYDVEWFKQNKIPLTLKKLNKKQILKAIKSTSLYSEEGYFPKDKGTSTKRFSITHVQSTNREVVVS